MASESTKPEPTLTPQFFVRPGPNQTKEEIVDDIAGFIIARANAWRAANGLPPMAEK